VSQLRHANCGERVIAADAGGAHRATDRDQRLDQLAQAARYARCTTRVTRSAGDGDPVGGRKAEDQVLGFAASYNLMGLELVQIGVLYQEPDTNCSLKTRLFMEVKAEKTGLHWKLSPT